MLPYFRVIPRLEIKTDNLIKGRRMEGLKVVDNFFGKISDYLDNGADEFFVEDIVASLYSREFNLNIITEIANLINIPLAFGGGIKNIEDIDKLLNAGADKISINTQAILNPKLIEDAAKKFGSQCIVINIQAKKIFNKYNAFYLSGRENSNICINEWICRIQDLGAGEITLVSVDYDGLCNGVDNELIDLISKQNLKIPLIYGGGIRNKNDINKLITHNIQGALVSHSLHYNKTTIKELKTL